MKQFFYQLVFRAVKSFILHAPKFFGGFEGIDLLDVCSSITGVSLTLLLRSPDICNERLDTYIHGKAVIATTALVVLAIVHSFSAFRFFVEIALRFRKFRYLWGKDKKLLQLNCTTNRPIRRWRQFYWLFPMTNWRTTRRLRQFPRHCSDTFSSKTNSSKWITIAAFRRETAANQCLDSVAIFIL